MLRYDGRRCGTEHGCRTGGKQCSRVWCWQCGFGRSYGRKTGPGFAGYHHRVVADRAPTAMHLGVDYFVLVGDDPVEQIRELTDGRGADYTIDVTGLTHVQEQCLHTTRPGDTVVLAGLAPVGSSTNLPGAPITRKEKIIKGSYYGSAQPKRDFARYAEYYLDGKLDLDSLITRTYALSNKAAAYSALLEGCLVRGVVIMDS